MTTLRTYAHQKLQKESNHKTPALALKALNGRDGDTAVVLTDGVTYWFKRGRPGGPWMNDRTIWFTPNDAN